MSSAMYQNKRKGLMNLIVNSCKPRIKFYIEKNFMVFD